eukprot:TRINITY_DN102854_c0_g1_i1.p1 TRINITY_DN102854_c0_g1~~TRINITY_DN102854_c0_g1_i1.p1  ORF type:complete len:277 (+),score=104.73 TRINITY_DN102854_c0_g1_i1:70-900(+)
MKFARLLLLAHGACGVSLLRRNATTVSNATAEETEPASDDNGGAVEAAENLLASLSAPKPTAAPKATSAASSSSSGNHSKLDFGFTVFEKNLTDEVSANIHKSLKGKKLSDAQQEQLVHNVTASISDNLKSLLTPLKQTIGKTWMALPQDEQRDEFVNQLKTAFQPVFRDNLRMVSTHFGLGLRRVEGFVGSDSALSADEAVQKSETALSEALFADHCYEDHRKNSNSTTASKFCIPSVLTKFVGRLNDTEGLIGMSMRFEAGAMSFAQNGQKGKK